MSALRNILWRAAPLSLFCFVAPLSVSSAESNEAGQLYHYTHLEIDLEKNTVSIPQTDGTLEANVTAELEDCSTQHFHCLKGGPIELVLPKRCASIDIAEFETVWQVGDYSTEVIWIEVGGLPPHHARDKNGLYLSNPNNPEIAYHFIPGKGIQRIFYHSRSPAYQDQEPTDFYAIGKTGALPDWLRGATLRQTSQMYYREGPALFADCE